ncbi:hypothetical protein Cgig2_013011 [Carnegiea gigantea]|uniref:Response regulatory domain-containing protein n=1 Tax=Carnegiea gigantea TaxID=171969 RepID=A0A9Q1GT05_9CARY|nr:hypothetical protein Cgig2_013011 [Carnegiea gigantea]
MLNMARNGGVSSRQWKSDSEIGLGPSDSPAEAHVLAVDDSVIDRKVIERLLRTSSCKVTAVDSGIRALEFLGLDEAQRTSVVDGLKVDLIITDYCMPGMTGYELLKRIKVRLLFLSPPKSRAKPHPIIKIECDFDLTEIAIESSTFKETPVVIMSSENVMARIDRCLEEGAEDFILKPVQLSDVKRLKDYMSREDRSKGRESRINKRKQRDGPDFPSQSPPSTRSPSSDSSVSSPLSPSPPSITSSSPSPSPSPSTPSSPSGPLDSLTTPSSPFGPFDCSMPSSPSGPSDSPTRQLKTSDSDQTIHAS